MAQHKLQDCVRAIAIAVQANVPVHTQGGPGEGKTRTMEAMGAAIEKATGKPFPVVVLTPSTMNDATDVIGLPYRENGVTKYDRPEWVAAAEQGGLVVFDEANTANTQIRAACLRVVQDGMVGTTPIKAARLLISNPEEMISGAQDFDPPMANRLCHIAWQPLAAVEWADAMTTGAWPADYDIVDLALAAAQLPAQAALTGAFIKARPDLLSVFPQDDNERSKAWPSRRTWELATRYLAGAHAAGYGPLSTVSFLGLAGLVGQGTATEFTTWVQQANLPDPEEILRDPSSYKTPRRGDLVHAVLMSVAVTAATRMTPSNWQAAWQVIAVTDSQGGHKDAAFMAARTLAKANAARPKADRFVNPAYAEAFLRMATTIAGA